MADVQNHNDKSEKSPKEQVHEFALGQGPILSEPDNNLFNSIKSALFGDPATKMKESMLQQLRLDIHGDLKTIDANTGDPFAFLRCSLLGREAASRPDNERANNEFLHTVDLVKNYTPEQMKEIQEITAAGHDPAKLKDAIANVSDVDSFTDLTVGLQLIAEINGNGDDAPIALTHFSGGRKGDQKHHPKIDIGHLNESIEVIGNPYRKQLPPPQPVGELRRF